MEDLMAQKSDKFRLWQYILLVLVLLFGFFIIFKVHYSYSGDIIDPNSAGFTKAVEYSYYKYPLHADEFTHIASSEYLMKEGSIPDVNPYYNNQRRNDVESGFHAFLATFFTVTGLDPLSFYQYMPAMIIMLTMTSLFLFVYVTIKNYWIALLSPLFLVFVKSNINLTGLWFLVPLTFSLFLLFMTLAAYFSTGKTKILALVFFVTSIFTYPLVSMILAGAIIINEAINAIRDKRHPLLKKKFILYYIAAVIVLSISILAIFKWKISSLPIVFKYGWTVYFEHTYMPWEMYNVILCVFALIGAFFVVFKRMNKMFMIMPLIILIPILMYTFLRFSLLIPYQRGFLLFMITLAPLTAIGIYYVSYYIGYCINYFISYCIKYFANHRAKNNEGQIRTLHLTILIILVLVAGAFALKDYYKIEDARFRLVYYIDDTRFNALTWAGANYDKSKILLVDTFTTFAVYPVSGLQTVAVPASNLGAGDMNNILDFYYKTTPEDCANKLEVLKRARAQLVMSNTRLACSYLKEVYDKGVYLYEINY